MDLTLINCIAELEQLGWSWEPSGEGEVRCKCPAHDDDTPSVNFNVDKGLWKCHAASCGASGDMIAFIAHATGAPRGVIKAALIERYGLEQVVEIPQSSVDTYAADFEFDSPLFAELKRRGVTAEMVKAARIGVLKNRVVIPVFDHRGRCVNIRKYMPGAPGPQKMRNASGAQTCCLYNVAEIKDAKRVWICGGEIKALAVHHLLKDDDCAAVAVTGSEGTWDPSFNKYLEGRDVYICMDIDAGGQKAVQRVGAQVLHTAASVYVIDLPLDPEEFPKGDVSDFLGDGLRGRQDLLDLMESAEELELDVQQITDIDSVEAEKVPLRNLFNPDVIGSKVEFEAVVSGFHETPYVVPRDVQVRCDRDQPNCALCPILAMAPDPVVQLPLLARGFISMVGSPENMKEKAIRDCLQIPTCKSVEIQEGQKMTVFDGRLSPLVDVSSDTGDQNIKYPVYIQAKKIVPNSVVKMTGVSHADPKDQSGIILVNNVEDSSDSLDNFSPTEEELAQLEIFQPEKNTVEAIEKKLAEIYADLSQNVTGIFGRQDMHLIIDLSIHSALFLQKGRKEITGWVDALIVGDSAQGKTEASQTMLRHYGVGRRVVCKAASFAGIVGGLQQVGSRWFATWGVVPQQDRRVAILEELKGLTVEDIGRMTDMRSSGVAELPKIEHGSTTARTRILAISNPRNKSTIREFPYPAQSFLDLIGSPEDTRRFDIGYIAADDIGNVSDHRPREKAKHSHVDVLCKRLVLFAWTRTKEQVFFTPEALQKVEDITDDLINEFFSVDIPLVDKGTTDEKVMRLSAALAARVFSVDEDKVVVHAEHVEVIHRLLQRTYRASQLGDYAKMKKTESVLRGIDSLDQVIGQQIDPYGYVSALIRCREITPQLMESLHGSRDIGNTVVGLFLRCSAVVSGGNNRMLKTEPFIHYLKEKLTTLPEKVDYEQLQSPMDEF